MIIKFSNQKFKDTAFTEGKEYQVINAMPSVNGGFWCEVETDIEGLYQVVRAGGKLSDPFGTFNVVAL